jgi:Xaa-Pro aminopeptidase
MSEATAARPPVTADHLRRTLDAMARGDVDVLVLGRESNARYLTGATRLWLAGTRPFNPGCIVVRRTGAVHLLSGTDDLVPLPRAQLYPMSWNPARIIGGVADVPGVAGARRVGVDGMTPLFEHLLTSTLGNVELADGEALLAAVRRTKSAADVDAIRAAIAVAERALEIALGQLRPGVRERDLLGAFAEAMAAQGVTTPAFEAVFASGERDPRSFSTARAIEAGDLVDASVGVLARGWEGRLARTRVCGPATPDHVDAWKVWSEEWQTLADRVRPGTPVGELRALGAEVTGVGAGDELLDDGYRLEPGVVLALGLRRGGVHGEDVLHVTPDGRETLTSFPTGP